MLGKFSADDNLKYIPPSFSRKQALTFHANFLLRSDKGQKQLTSVSPLILISSSPGI